MAKRYVVYVGMPGYLPDSYYVCETLAEAFDYAKFERDEFRQLGYRVLGNIRKDWQYIVRRRLFGNEWLDYVTIQIECCELSDEELEELEQSY